MPSRSSGANAVLFPAGAELKRLDFEEEEQQTQLSVSILVFTWRNNLLVGSDMNGRGIVLEPSPIALPDPVDLSLLLSYARYRISYTRIQGAKERKMWRAPTGGTFGARTNHPLG